MVQFQAMAMLLARDRMTPISKAHGSSAIPEGGNPVALDRVCVQSEPDSPPVTA